MAKQLITQEEYRDRQMAMAFHPDHLYFFFKDTGKPADQASEDDIMMHWAEGNGALEFTKKFTVGSK